VAKASAPSSGMGSPSRRAADTLIIAIGFAALAVEAYALAGRAPDLFLMRGLGARSIALVAVSETAFLGAVWFARRRRGRGSRATMTLAAACVGASIAAMGVMLRHPLTGAFEFPHRDWELAVTRAALWGTALLFMLLWCWQGVSDAVATGRAQGARGWRLAGTLARIGWRRARGPAANLALSAAAILLTLVLFEGAVRLMLGVPFFAFENPLTARLGPLASAVSRYDSLLGWVHADNQDSGPEGAFSTGEHGVRMNGPMIAPVPHHAILAVGDSFTAGSGVDNAHSWPAQLEVLLGEPVVNAATGGWGADQIVLRAESLIPVFEPREIVVSFLAEDIVRASYETFGGGKKPYFTVANGALVPHNIPVPLFTGRASDRGWWRRIVGYSQLAIYTMRATGSYERWAGAESNQISTDVAEVSCLLLKRLKLEADARHIPLNFVLQYDGSSIAALDSEPAYATRVMACAQRLGIATMNTWPTLREIQRRDPAALTRLYDMNERPGSFGHMTAAGNALIARLVAETLRSNGSEGGRR
jgi:lysophospholipase L1-like esterase